MFSAEKTDNTHIQPKFWGCSTWTRLPANVAVFADEQVILFSHCEINFAGVQNVEVRDAISTDPNHNHIPNR